MTSPSESILDRPPCPRPWRHQGSLAILAGYRAPDPNAGNCGCGYPLPEVAFDPRDANLPEEVVRRRWPRFHGHCKNCGQMMILYASAEHFIAGDW